MLARVVKSFRQFVQSEEAPTATEYAVMLALIIVVAIVAIQTLGQNVSSTFKTTSDNLAAS